jgi:DNA-binding protein HU-beta
MTKAELIEKIANACNVPKTTADKMLETFIETVTSTLKAGGEVVLTGFGTFSAKKRAARMGINPKKPGEKIQIPAMVVPKFKAGKSLKDALK